MYIYIYIYVDNISNWISVPINIDICDLIFFTDTAF